MAKNIGKENQHEDVYGKSFALYDHDAMKEFINFFDQRFEINGLDPASIFADKKCLDAGCGNGRGALFMLANGASSVDCVDISQTNIDSTSRNIDQFGFGNYSCHLNSLESLPFPDNTFDFVWCNGVIMHTHNPDKCISELSRVLKNGGKAWIYVYGSGGLYWYCVQRFRKITKDIAPNFCISLLRLLGYSSRYVGEY
jgi:ubiquinone/menaquinone biosynthesis C-methylase UbiE